MLRLERGTEIGTWSRLARSCHVVSSEAPFEVAMTGYTQLKDHSLAKEFAAAGVTWWIESLHARRGDHEEMIARVQSGPPA